MQGQQVNAMLPQSPYKKWTLKPYHIKYYGLIAVFFMMISAVKVFVNYATIQTSIARVSAERESIARHKQYSALQAYAYTIPEAAQFIAHDNSLLLPGEHIFLFTQGTGAAATWIDQGTQGIQPEIPEMSPWQSWIYYFAQKMEP